MIVLILQTGSAVGGNDYAITSLSAGRRPSTDTENCLLANNE
jgi:hypothetical protein